MTSSALEICWRYEADVAQLQTGALTAQVDPRVPARGLTSLEVSRTAWGEVELLGLPLSTALAQREAVADCYVRGGDLVVTYVQSPERPARVQVYWRVGQEPAPPSGCLAAIDLQISVQTSRWESWPELATSSRLPRGDLFWLTEHDAWQACASLSAELDPRAPACILVRSAKLGVSYVEMLHPSDVAPAGPGSRLDVDDSGCRLLHRLFREPLERGVIRRARVRGLFLPQAGDEPMALAAYRAFSAAEPPLTT